MEMQLIIAYCICDDVVKNLGIREDPQVKMNMAEVMVTALAAMKFFGGNYERARVFMMEYGYIPNMLSKSQFSRRLKAISDHVWETVCFVLSEAFKLSNETNEFVVDSFPVPVCQNIRIRRCKIYKDEKYRGYLSSKRVYFYGLKVHMIATTKGEPVEFVLAPGSSHDAKVFKDLDLDLPENSTLYGDAAYNIYEQEDLLKEASKISLIPQRKKNSKRQFAQCVKFICDVNRKIVETTFSCISMLFPKTIHAVTACGFELKVFLFVLAYSFNRIL